MMSMSQQSLMMAQWTELKRVEMEEQIRTSVAKVADLEFKHKGMEQWHNELQKRVATLEGTRDKAAFQDHELKGQAAQVQATTGFIHPGDASACDPSKSMPAHMVYQPPEHLYAPLRSDTRPLLEMSAFVRKVAVMKLGSLSDLQCVNALYTLVVEADELVKRNT